MSPSKLPQRETHQGSTPPGFSRSEKWIPLSAIWESNRTQNHHKIDDEKNHLPCAGKSQDCREDSHLQRYLPKFHGKKKCVKIPARQYITFIVICFSSTSSSIIPSSPRTGHCKVQIAPCTKPPQDAWPRFFGLTNSVLSMEVWFSDTLMLWMVGCLSVYHRLSIFFPLFIGFDT